MRVRLETDREGSGGYKRAGEVIDLPEDEARRLIADRQARPVAAAPETATRTPPENAARPTSRRKK